MRALSLCLTLACLAASCGLARAGEPDPFGFLMVRTDLNLPIVDNGVVNPEWASQATPYLTREFEYPLYQLFFNSTAPAGMSQQFTLAYQSTRDAVCTTLQGTESNTIFANTQQRTNSVSTTICRQDGTVDMMVTLSLLEGTTVTHTLAWTYRKTCIVPLIQVGTTPYGFDVVQQTQTNTAFNSWIVQGASLDLYLYLLNPVVPAGQIPTEAPFTLTFTTSDQSQLDIGAWTYNNTDPLSGNVVSIMQDASYPIGLLTIPFVCQANQPPSYQTVYVSMNYHYETSLAFQFVVQCGQLQPVTTVQIGATSGSANIAAAGVTAADWQLAKPHLFHANQIAAYEFDVFLCFECASTPGTATQAFVMTYNVVQPNILSVSWLNGATGAGELVPGQVNEQIMSVQVQCLTNGTAEVQFEVFLGPTNDMIAYAFTYDCVFPFLDIAYGGATGQAVAMQSMPTPAWSGQSGATAVTISDQEATSVFFIYLDGQSNNPALLPMQWYSLDFSFDSTIMNEPTVDDHQFANAPYLVDSQPVRIQWNCLKPGAAAINMTVNYGWTSTMVIQFNKQCPAGHKGDSGWSVAGVFFFVLFLLCLALCFGGCAFNYFKQDKRGLSVVPLYASASACYDKVRGTDRNWTPQMETNAARRTNYSNFEDDAGASYQSNL